MCILKMKAYFACMLLPALCFYRFLSFLIEHNVLYGPKYLAPVSVLNERIGTSAKQS